MIRALVVAAGACAALSAQARNDGLVLLLYGPSKLPVAGAEGYLVCEPTHELEALRGLPGAAAAPTVLRAKSNERGELRFQREGDMRAGSGFVWTAHGLGVVVSRLLPGRPQRLTMAPMAALATSTGSETFGVWPRAHVPGSAPVTLLPLRGTEVWLPAGVYDVWAESADGWIWRRLELASTERTELAWRGDAQRVQAPAGTVLYPEGRPDVDLLRGRTEIALRDEAVRAPLSAQKDGRHAGPRILPAVRPDTPIVWPPADAAATPTARLAWDVAGDVRATLYGVQRGDGGRWRVLGASPLATDADGTRSFELPPAAAGDAWLLVVAEGRAPIAVPWLEGAKLPPLPDAGLPLAIAAHDENGDPVVDLAVEFVPDGMDAAAVTARADGRGIVRLGHVAVPGELRISDERHANDVVPIAAALGKPLPVVVKAGASLSGTVVDAEGRPLAGVLVTVRDPRGLLRPPARSCTTGADGKFTFGGLPEEVALVVFATARRDQHTWSGRLPFARAGGDPLRLELRDEDPELRIGRQK